jgi:hypothetical protein
MNGSFDRASSYFLSFAVVARARRAGGPDNTLTLSSHEKFERERPRESPVRAVPTISHKPGHKPRTSQVHAARHALKCPRRTAGTRASPRVLLCF